MKLGEFLMVAPLPQQEGRLTLRLGQLALVAQLWGDWSPGHCYTWPFYSEGAALGC